MNKLYQILIFLFAIHLYFPAAMAKVEPSCQPLIKSSEARIAVPAWEQVSVVSPSGFTMKAAFVNGNSYRQSPGEAWVKSPVSYSETERQMIAQINKGEIVLSNCSLGAEKIIDGVVTKAFQYTIKMPGFDAAQSTLYIGVADGLPYLQESVHVRAAYNYKNVKVE